MSAGGRGGGRDNHSDDERADPTKMIKREGKPLPPTFPPHPKLPPPAELDDKELNIVTRGSEIRTFVHGSPYYIVVEKKLSYIERYQDRYNVPTYKMPLYRFIDSFIKLFPEEIVTGKAKRRWTAARRAKDIAHPDAAELFGESDEEDGEEGSEKDEDDLFGSEDDAEQDEDGDYAYNDFSDDDDGGDGGDGGDDEPWM